MKKVSFLCFVLLVCIGLLAGCASTEPPVSSDSSPSESSLPASEPSQPLEENDAASEETPAESGDTPTGVPSVYMTTDISADGLMAVYEALGASPSGDIAVKLSTGEPGSNYLRTDLIGDLVQSFDNPTIVECNTAYGGQRANTAMHYQVAEDHGYTAIANVDIMDENGSMTLPVTGGSNLTENYVGANFANYDYYVVLSHFKGHSMAGYGGAIKNISIGIASSEGKAHIHSGGTGGSIWGGDQDAFLESMAEAGKSVVDYLDGNILYINVMNRLSVDCDCDGSPAEPDMHDIGILASFDPVALDQACVDLVYSAEDGASLMMSSILLNPQLIIYSAALGGTVLAVRIVSCFLCGITAGWLLHFFYRDKPFFNFSGFDEPKSRDTDPNLLIRYLKNLWRNIRSTGPYFFIGILLSALFQRYVPAEAMTILFGKNEALGVLMAATIGVPLYACGGGTIPLLQQWLWDGMSVGSAASFMLTGPSTKITNLGALKIVLGMKRFLLYLAYVMVFSFITGLVVNLIV